MRKLTFRSCLVAVAMLMLGSTAQAQDFLSQYDKITDKNFDEFVSMWISWSKVESVAASREKMNDLTNQVVTDLSKGSDYVSRYNENSAYTVLQYELSVNKHSGNLGKRKPQTDEYNADEVESITIRPYAETGKPILYLNNEIAMMLMDYLQKDKDGKRREKLEAMFHIVPDSGGYHFCSVPYVAHFDVFADCVVVDARVGWGTGSWYKYVTTTAYKQSGVVAEWMR